MACAPLLLWYYQYNCVVAFITCCQTFFGDEVHNGFVRFLLYIE